MTDSLCVKYVSVSYLPNYLPESMVAYFVSLPKFLCFKKNFLGFTYKTNLKVFSVKVLFIQSVPV